MCYFMRDTVLSHYCLLFEGGGKVVYKLLKPNKPCSVLEKEQRGWIQAHTHEHTRVGIQHIPDSGDEI